MQNAVVCNIKDGTCTFSILPRKDKGELDVAQIQTLMAHHWNLHTIRVLDFSDQQLLDTDLPDLYKAVEFTLLHIFHDSVELVDLSCNLLSDNWYFLLAFISHPRIRAVRVEPSAPMLQMIHTLRVFLPMHLFEKIIFIPQEDLNTDKWMAKEPRIVLRHKQAYALQ